MKVGDFMGFHIRTAIILASLAAAIAFLFGVLAGVPFGTVVLRTVLGGVVFAGIGYGAAVLIERFLPELLEMDDAADEDTGGETLDVSVGDDSEDDDIRRAAFQRPDEDGTTASDSSDPGSATNSTQESAQASQDSAEDGFQPGIRADLVEEIQESRVDDDSGSAADEASTAASGDEPAPDEVAALESLPDMEGMEDAFISTEQPTIDEAPANEEGSADTQQAQEIAQAIRTVLQREEQG